MSEKLNSLKSRLENTHLSDRGVSDYMRDLEIAEEDLNDPKTIILDLGAGMQQNFAKEMKKRSFQSRVVSLDPRLGLSADEDIALVKAEDPLDHIEIEKRLKNRERPESLAVAAISAELPFKDSSFQSVYALYSVPYYLMNNYQEIKHTLEEVVRVTKPGGSIRAFPIIKDKQGLDQVSAVKQILEGMKGVDFKLTLKGKPLGDEDWLLIIKKNPENKKK